MVASLVRESTRIFQESERGAQTRSILSNVSAPLGSPLGQMWLFSCWNSACSCSSNRWIDKLSGGINLRPTWEVRAAPDESKEADPQVGPNRSPVGGHRVPLVVVPGRLLFLSAPPRASRKPNRNWLTSWLSFRQQQQRQQLAVSDPIHWLGLFVVAQIKATQQSRQAGQPGHARITALAKPYHCSALLMFLLFRSVYAARQ